jgi:ferrous iron transport protein B
MFFISTITIIMALIIAKVPHRFCAARQGDRALCHGDAHLPFAHRKGGAAKGYERTWQYIKKVGTIVVAVSVCVFALLQFPGLADESMQKYEARMQAAMAKFQGGGAKAGRP